MLITAMRTISGFCYRFRSRKNYVWGSMLGIAVCWGWANILRENLAGEFSVTQFVAENWIFTVVAAFGVLLWTVATWERFRCIGASEAVATTCTAALAVVWGYLFCWRMWPLLALGLLLVVPLPLAIAGAEKNQETDVQHDEVHNGNGNSL